jgi:V/A-type H+/Na+-transporting ATPase subunit E
VGYAELLRVIGEEAAREAEAIRAAGVREAARIRAEAGAAAGAAADALRARARAQLAERARLDREAGARDRERALLVVRRRALDLLRAEAIRALATAGGPALDARLLAELRPEIGPGPVEVVVDPGAEEACRAAIERLDPALAARTRVRAAPAPRGGIEVIVGRLVLDDTLPARLDRAWPDVEAGLAAILFGDGAWPGSTA